MILKFFNTKVFKKGVIDKFYTPLEKTFVLLK